MTKVTNEGTPAAIAAAIARIEAAAERGGLKLPRGASEEAIAGAEATLGVSFPAEVRAFYLAHDGGPDGDPAFRDRELLSLDGIVGQWTIWKELLDNGTFEANDHGTPGPGVQKKWWIAAWVPVTYDGAGNHEMIDLAPAEGGTRGQVISFWHDDDPRTVEATSFLAWLEAQRWGAE